MAVAQLIMRAPETLEESGPISHKEGGILGASCTRNPGLIQRSPRRTMPTVKANGAVDTSFVSP